MSQIRLNCDEDAMDRHVVAALRLRGLDLLTANEVRMLGRDDKEAVLMMSWAVGQIRRYSSGRVESVYGGVPSSGITSQNETGARCR